MRGSAGGPGGNGGPRRDLYLYQRMKKPRQPQIREKSILRPLTSETVKDLICVQSAKGFPK